MRLPKQSRTIALKGHPDHGEGKDNGKWFRCWNCGFICNKDREALGGPATENKITVQAYAQVDQYGAAAGTTRYYPIVEQGCPLCGSMNWRGDY